MAELSPAARAVLEAMPFFSHEPTRRAIAAGILRALADHQQAPVGEGPIDHWSPDDRTRRELRNLADELEGVTRDPLEPNDLSHLSQEEFQALAPQGFHAP